MDEIINLNNVHFGYTTHTILSNFHLNVKYGEFISIVGENGSGKSTLIKLLLYLNVATSGSVTVSARAGYVPQKLTLQGNFPASVWEVILSGTISRNSKSIWYTKADKDKAKQVMKELGIVNIRNSRFMSLSGGQQQRVLIARALCATEQLLILDEPVNGLDPGITHQIYQLLTKLNKEKGFTIIMVSHDLERALNYSTRVIELTNGLKTYDGYPFEYSRKGR